MEEDEISLLLQNFETSSQEASQLAPQLCAKIREYQKKSTEENVEESTLLREEIEFLEIQFNTVYQQISSLWDQIVGDSLRKN